ncbi:hypothetical protein [Bradyrhizobium sp. Ce-3]|uniref:hypothetical protein n=1 Tax=Bradyrhizobium sp. Ce-3 TaxID=2913970 RepID=UPI001FC84D9C|nr:hypothetical protein [Bradyrhizobium sp. Ce-3]
MISSEPGFLIRIDEIAAAARPETRLENFLLKFESDAQQTFQSARTEFFLIVRATPTVACLSL